MLNLFRVLILILLAIVITFTVTNPIEEQSAAIFASSGKRYPARQIVSFPIIMETSSLTYDDSSASFYTTADKGRPHIIQFRLDGEKVDLIRADTIKGLAKNFDFEGIELVARPGQPRYLQISTERFRRHDSIVNPAVSLSDFTYLPDKSFAVRPQGMGQNNNFEGVTYSPSLDLFLLAKERQPFGLYGRQFGKSAFAIFGEEEFTPAYLRFVDSMLSPVLPADRMAILREISFSGLAFDIPSNNLLILNRFGRSVISVKLAQDSILRWQVVDVWPYEGVDDAKVESTPPASLIYGLAEGIAVWGEGEARSIGLITDPGTGGRPTLYVFPYPR